MADLNEMREFHRHWTAYRDDERALARLCTRAPVDLTALTPEERTCSPLEEPASVRYDERALASARGNDEGVLPRDLVVDEARWGWWLESEDWSGVAALREHLSDLERGRAELASRERAAQAVLDVDPVWSEAVAALRAHEDAGGEERVELAALEETRVERAAALREGRPLSRRQVMWAVIALVVAVAGVIACCVAPLTEMARAVCALAWVLAVALACLRPWSRPLPSPLAARRRREELALLDQRIADMRAKVALRERLAAEQREAACSRAAVLRAPGDEAIRAVEDELAATERSIIAALDRDLTRRDACYEQGSLDELPFAEALARAYEREWALLEDWMAAYTAALPSSIEHAENVLASELVWLEGHAPYGKRFWPLTDAVMETMECARDLTSDAALERCRAEADATARS